jgi:lipoprotein-anchoring transpeptidase ErfK/SrfK
VADVLHGTELRSTPGGRMLAKIAPRTEFGSPQTLLVVRRSPGWLGVVSPEAGNGRVGWIPAAAGAVHAVSYELRVSLSARRLTVLDGGAVVARYTVAVGRPDAPTPTGRFAVTDRLAPRPETGAYGCCILALSAHSPHTIQGWTGGDRIAIHSTADTSTLGQPVSHGCVRVNFDEGRWLMQHVPLGTPAIVSQ